LWLYAGWALRAGDAVGCWLKGRSGRKEKRTIATDPGSENLVCRAIVKEASYGKATRRHGSLSIACTEAMRCGALAPMGGAGVVVEADESTRARKPKKRAYHHKGGYR
jgi:hypothetical protein